MTFSDFTLTSAESLLRLRVIAGELFTERPLEPIPDWLREQLRRGRRFALTSDKARAEFLVAPILSAVCERSGDALTIFSGERLDVDAELGLAGVCDFILALTEPLPRLKAPLVTILEAKKHGIESGIGQCIAQMFAAQRFNERSGFHSNDVFGCVTSGEIWQFLRLRGAEAIVDRDRYFIDKVGSLLAAFADVYESALTNLAA